MSSNVAATRKAYRDFASGDLEMAMHFLDNAVEWIVPGRSAVSGKYAGKAAVRQYWDVLARRNHTTTPLRFLSDDEVVVVLTMHDQDGDEPSLCADILTFRNGRVARFESVLDTASLERLFGLDASASEIA